MAPLEKDLGARVDAYLHTVDMTNVAPDASEHVQECLRQYLLAQGTAFMDWAERSKMNLQPYDGTRKGFVYTIMETHNQITAALYGIREAKSGLLIQELPNEDLILEGCADLSPRQEAL